MVKKSEIVIGLFLIIGLIISIYGMSHLNHKFADCYASEQAKDLFWENDTCYGHTTETRYDCQRYNRTAHKEFCVNLWGGEFE